MASLQTPSPTLFVSNIEGKTKKPELRSALYALFNPFGQILDVVAKKHDKGRGQAFIVFSDQTSATSALRSLSGESFYGKKLDITYAKKPSNATIARDDPTKSREAAAVQAAKLVVSRAQGEYEQLEKEREDQENGIGKRGLEDGDAGGAADGDSGRETKRQKQQQDADDEDEMEIEMEDDEDALPQANGSGVSLICTNLPAECTEEIMSALYSQNAGFSKATPYTGAKPSSHSAPNPGAKSFRVSFASPEQAAAAAEATKGYLMQPGWAMGVSVE